MTFFSKNLKYLRLKVGKNQPDVAEELGHPSRSRIANYEAGSSKPGFDDLIALGKYYKINLEDLVNTDLSEQGNATPAQDAQTDVNITYLQLEVETLQKRIKTLQAINDILSTESEDLKASNANILLELKKLAAGNKNTLQAKNT